MQAACRKASEYLDLEFGGKYIYRTSSHFSAGNEIRRSEMLSEIRKDV